MMDDGWKGATYSSSWDYMMMLFALSLQPQTAEAKASTLGNASQRQTKVNERRTQSRDTPIFRDKGFVYLNLHANY